MTSPLPNSSDFTGAAVTEGGFKSAMTNLISYLSGILGADGSTATALKTLGAAFNQTVAKSTAYTVTAADKGKVLRCSGTWALSFSAGAALGNGFSATVINTGSGTLTLTPFSGENIDGASALPLASGRSVIVTCNGANLRTVGGVAASEVSIQTFNSSGTWSKPSSGSMVLVEAWGAGGGGGTVNRGGGGGGGAYACRVLPLSSLAATETVTVAASAAAGSAGGNSAFGAHLTAYGGAAGQSSAGGFGGGGGGQMGAGSGVSAGAPTGYYGQGGVDGGDGGAGHFHGGGGGAGGGGLMGPGKSGGDSVYGGGGGVGSGDAGGAPGTSLYGGAGGGAGGAGTQPGGGGGGAGGTGAAGRVKVTVW